MSRATPAVQVCRGLPATLEICRSTPVNVFVVNGTTIRRGRRLAKARHRSMTQRTSLSLAVLARHLAAQLHRGSRVVAQREREHHADHLVALVDRGLRSGC